METNKALVRAALVVDPDTGYPIPDYFGTANWAYSPTLRKFIDAMPGLGPNGANTLGQYIPVAVPDKTSYPGCDYYEIAVVEFKEQMHSDLPPTTLRGYVQLSTIIVPGALITLTHNGVPVLKGDGTQAYAVDAPHYMGPAIIATRDIPVRIKFYNLLPTGDGGDLFVPVDTTVMGAGHGPLGHDAMPMNYTQNRANIHLHGNNTVWISDGTPHQWITPAGEDTPYPQGVSVVPVPDMADSGAPDDGVMLFNGRPVHVRDPQQARALGISMVFQHFSLFETLSVAENVWLGLQGTLSLREVTESIEVKAREYGMDVDPRRTVPSL